MNNTVQTTFRIDKKILEKVEKACWMLRQTKANFYVMAIERYIDELEKQGLLEKYDKLFREIRKE